METAKEESPEIEEALTKPTNEENKESHNPTDDLMDIFESSENEDNNSLYQVLNEIDVQTILEEAKEVSNHLNLRHGKGV